MTSKIKKELDSFYTKNYEQLKEIAGIFTKKEFAEDLVHTLYSTLISSKGNGLANAIKADNIFNFIFVSLRNQAYGPSTQFNKELFKNKSDAPLPKLYSSEYKPTEGEKEWLIITKELHNLRDNNTITDYQLQIFNLYHNFEEVVSIKGMTQKEVSKLRKMSLRRLSTETEIGYLSIWNTQKFVLELLKEQPIIKNLIKNRNHEEEN